MPNLKVGGRGLVKGGGGGDRERIDTLIGGDMGGGWGGGVTIDLEIKYLSDYICIHTSSRTV